MNSFQLKIIAVITMLIDHIGSALFPQYMILRWIGRISFPIYCFLIAEGTMHTHNIHSYLARMAAFAAISEIPYNLMKQGKIIVLGSCNVFFTLSIGIAAIICIKKLKNVPAKILSVAVLSLFAYWINCDYDWYGIMMIAGFYLAGKKRYGVPCVQAGATQLYCLDQMLRYHVSMLRVSQQCSMLSIPVIMAYNGEKGYSSKTAQWLFYAFYPAHLTALWAIKIIISA